MNRGSNKLTQQADVDQQEFFDRCKEAARKVREKFGHLPLAYTQVAHTLNQGIAAAQKRDFKMAESKLATVNEWLELD